MEAIKTFIVAEIGCNHKGDFKIAKEMIRVAAEFCKVDAIKFQKRHPKELLTKEEYDGPHPDGYYTYGKTYGEHREMLEFNIDQHKKLRKLCKKYKVKYSSSVWDLTSAKEMVSINPDFIKIPSPCNLDFPLLRYVAENYKGEIHISFGMTTPKEEEEIISFFQKLNRNKDLVIYSCVSGYPVEFGDLSLLDVKRLKDKFGGIVKGIGFSGHHMGIAADIAALTFGARYFERHFTLNRAWKGTDHAASLEPDGLRRLTRDIKHVSEALRYKKTDILECEKPQRVKLKKIHYEYGFRPLIKLNSKNKAKKIRYE